MNLSSRLLIVSAVLCAATLRAQSPSAAIARGDSCWNALDSWHAYLWYTNAAEHHGDDRQIAWRMARNYTAFALTATSSENETWNYARAKEYAERAVGYDDANEEGHIALAVFYGWRTYMEPDNEGKIRASRTMHDEVEKALALNPGDDFAWNLRGQWNREVAKLSWIKKLVVNMVYGGLPDATYERSLDDLQHAIQLRPQRIMHALEIGKTYLAMGKKQEAREALQRAIDLPHNDGVDEKEKEEARRLLDAMN